VGVAVFSGGALLDITSSSALAVIAVIAAAASWGLGAVFTRVRLRDEHPLVLSASLLVVGGLLLAPIVGAIDGPSGLSLGLKSGLSVLAMGLMGGGFAYVMYFWLLDRIGVIKTSLASYIMPVTGLLLGWAVLDEAVDASALGGLALIVGGIALVTGFPLLPRLRPAVSPVRREDGP
jgi:drug/metabolite transporter (DMT)-like permease